MHIIQAIPFLKDGRQLHTDRGPIYTVTHNGEVLIARTHEPFYNSARALLEKGLTGEMGMATGESVCLTGDIEGCAKFSLFEAEGGFRLKKYKPFKLEGTND